MSSTRQALVRGPNFTGFGKRPSLIPFHHVERPTGKTSRTFGNRTYPVVGSCGETVVVFMSPHDRMTRIRVYSPDSLSESKHG